MILFVIRTNAKVASCSRRVTSVLHEDNGPIILTIGGISSKSGVCSTFRFCSLKLNRVCDVSTTGNNKAKSLLSTVIGRLPTRSPSRSRRPRLPRFAVIKGPGMKGSSLAGTLLNGRHGVIAPVTKAAHSSVTALCGGFNRRFVLISATNVEGGTGIRRSLRFCSIVESVHTVRRSSIYVLVISTRAKVRSRSVTVFGLVRHGGGNYIIIIGG